MSDRPFAIRWGTSYAIFTPENPVCGFILNPGAEKIYELNFCNRPAVYGFRFRSRNPLDPFNKVGWQGACSEHAAVIRGRDDVSEMWSL